MSVWHHRARLDLKHHVALVAVYVVYEISGLVDLYNQLLYYGTGILAHIILIAVYDLLSFLVLAAERGYLSFFVIFDPDFRIYAQDEKTFFCNCCFFCLRGSASGQKDCRHQGQ